MTFRLLLLLWLVLALAACAGGPGASIDATATGAAALTTNQAAGVAGTAPATTGSSAASSPTRRVPPSPSPTPPATATPLPTPTDTETPVPTDTATPTRVPAAAPPPTGPATLGDTWLRPGDGMVMVYVPGGTFEMGSLPDDDQFGPHTVTVDSFWIDQLEVTNAQYAAFANVMGNPVEGGYAWLEVDQPENCQIELVDGVYRPERGKEAHPVVEVSSYGAAAYCAWVGGRLPTEAEWEYAARGTEAHVYPWGNEPPTCERSQFGGCGDYSVPAGSTGQAGASWCGAQDMAGNVWEWTANYYGPYPDEAQINPTGPESGERMIARGGSYMSDPSTLHAAYRYSTYPTGRTPNHGFRCAASAR